MAHLLTHYETLKVARDAPPEVIRAAYRSLSQKYHPDRNPEDADAASMMSRINTAYEILSSPEKRLEHDSWIRRVERGNEHSGPVESPVAAQPRPPATAQGRSGYTRS